VATDERASILRWGAPRLRDLPWRATRDPWSILVAETMLQQTQVLRVVERYEAFLARFPTTAVCATHSSGEVQREWAGLGYNRRAVNLHRAAVMIETDWHGEWPRDVSALQRLPGVGPYTARAIGAFAFEMDVAVVDTNVARILARRAPSTNNRRAVQDAADALAPVGDSWIWNQVILDLGATVCTARQPACDQCPLAAAGTCSWRLAGNPDPDPAIGSAGVSGGQSRFDGSDRQGRGRLVAALRRAPVGVADLATVMGWPADPERARRVADTVVRDDIAVIERGIYRLP
jgi:A/G-specific adenine glycosylase